MSTKNVIYFYDVCGMSIEDIAKQLGLTQEKVKEILGKTPIYAPVYAPRMRYNGWVNGK